MRLVLDRSARVLAGGTIVIGGRPARLLRLTPAGAALVTSWRDGAPVGDAPRAVALARRLVDAGVAHPVPDRPGPFTTADVAVVIPARDRVDDLAACLDSVGSAHELIVVDDGSNDPGPVRAVASRTGARVIRRPSPAGPAQARNDGAAASSAPLLAFVDSDVRTSAEWLAGLLGHFADPAVAAVAPRVVVPPGTGALSAYEAVRSPLDLGDAPGPVGPGRRPAFVPAAALVVRREAFERLGGFDPALRVGEDVDLVWRLAAAGWTVRYEPSVKVSHPHRAGSRAWLRQRISYGSSAGPLARRHPGKLRHLVLPAWITVPAALAASGRTRGAAAAALLAGGTVAARLPSAPEARRQLIVWAAGAQLRIVQQALDAGWRVYPPLVLAAALTTPRLRRPLAIALAASVAADWLARRPRLDPVSFGALRAADDLAYAAGVWLGCARERTLGPLVPELVPEPRRARTGAIPWPSTSRARRDEPGARKRS
ncbi:MAG TPA: mycofactocin biosynthesis glycosyltransferase MftF [Solirubrobacteraceae bacterium]|nr:mycofactocin biosynthesis glycosyltransferase MftF [Solirubrobacteraceae bacterium]